MLALFGFGSLLALAAFHTFLAGVATRFFRLRLSTSWGPVVYTVVLTPILLFVSTLFFLAIGVGSGVYFGSSTVLLALLVALPLALGVAVEYLYVPAPDEYDLPDTR